jgi:YggT family protein
MTADLPNLFRYVVFAAAALATAAALGAMAVQTRRINPFGTTARFVRRCTDPFLEPIERRLVRAGLNPQHAPWWLVGITIFGGILLLTLVEWTAIQTLVVRSAIRQGGRSVLYIVLDWTFGLLGLALIIRVVASWIGLSPYHSWMRPVVFATEWFLAPLRRLLPPFAMFDFSPLIAWFLIQVLRATVLARL